MSVDFVDPKMIHDEVVVVLDEVEGRLLTLVREGSQTTSNLNAIIDGLGTLVLAIQAQYNRLQDSLDARDLSYELTTDLAGVRRRALWLYRKCRLEMLFFAKLRAERDLRDTLYRQVIEMYEELSGFEEAERSLQALPEPELAARLLRDDGASVTPPHGRLRRLVD
jgi:hypothetical protein